MTHYRPKTPATEADYTAMIRAEYKRLRKGQHTQAEADEVLARLMVARYALTLTDPRD